MPASLVDDWWRPLPRGFSPDALGVLAGRSVRAFADGFVSLLLPVYLLRLGFLDRTPQGRIATDLARAHLSKLGYEIPPPRRAEPGMTGLWDLPSDEPAGG